MSGACITAVDAGGRPVKFAAVWGQDSTQSGSTTSELDMVRLISFVSLSIVIASSTSLSNDTTYIICHSSYEGNTSIFIARIDSIQEL